MSDPMGDRVQVQFSVPDIYFGTVCNQPPRPTQPFIPLESVTKDKLWPGKKRQVWFILLADERGV